jgi:hypothetical protein
MSHFLELLPERMRSTEFLNSMSTDHKKFMIRLKENHGDVVAANYLRLIYGIADERPTLVCSDHKNVTVQPQVLVFSREKKGVLVELEIGSYHLPISSIRPDSRFIAIAINDGLPVDYVLSKHQLNAVRQVKKKVEEFDEILLHEIQIEQSRIGA